MSVAKSDVPRADLTLGEVVYVKVLLDILDFPPEKSKGTTYKKVKNGHLVQRLAVVIAISSDSITVAYLATFGFGTTLPSGIDAAYWWPVTPAAKEGNFDPLPQTDGAEQWVSLRQKHIIDSETVQRVDNTQQYFSPESAALIAAAMKS